jgi:hypothetical protein
MAAREKEISATVGLEKVLKDKLQSARNLGAANKPVKVQKVIIKEMSIDESSQKSEVLSE